MAEVDGSEEKTGEKPQKTLFIRNLPYSTSNKKLEETFSDFGPIKQAFVVKDKGELCSYNVNPVNTARNF